MNNTIETTYNEVRELMKPLIKYLNDNHNPYTTIIITPTGFEIVEGVMSGEVLDYLKD